MNQVLLQESLNALKWKLNQYLTSEEPTKDIGDFYCSSVFFLFVLLYQSTTLETSNGC